MPDDSAIDDDPTDEHRPLSSPYGPHYRKVDEAAGGADSSPFENVPSGERKDAARTPPQRGDGGAAKSP